MRSSTFMMERLRQAWAHGLSAYILALAATGLAWLLTAANGIMVQDPNGRLRYANPAAAEQLGYPSAAALLAAPEGEALGRFRMQDAKGGPLTPSELPGRRVLDGAPAAELVVRSEE